MSFTRAESFPLHTHRASHAMFVYGGEWTDRVGYSALRSASPSGAPSPVQASHPALAL